MDNKLLRPFEKGVDQECEGISRLKERSEFRDPTDWAIYQAKIFYEGFGDIEKAIEILEAEQTRVPQDANVMFCLAECYSRTSGRLVRAVELCTTGLSIDATSDYGYTIKARTQLALGRPIDCYQSAMEALRRNMYNFEAAIYLGIVGFAIARADENEEEMRLSIQNLRLTQECFPQSRMVARLIKENEMWLAEFLGTGSESAG